MNTRCAICEFADRDYGILMASVSLTPSHLIPEKQQNAWARLTAWVTHLRSLPDARAHLAQQPELRNLSGTAYIENVLGAIANPKLQAAGLAALKRSDQDQAIAAALVLIISGTPVLPVVAPAQLIERIALSWGWRGPRPDWPAGAGKHSNI